MFGGFQQMGLRPGTEDVVLAVGMSRALELFWNQSNERMTRIAFLRDKFEELVLDHCEMVVINGLAAGRVSNTSNISFLGVDRQALLMAADLAGLALATGSACASGSSQPSPVLVAMEAEKAVVESSIRISFGATSSLEDVNLAANRIIKIVNNLRIRSS
jgi:cysteine desulfurase